MNAAHPSAQPPQREIPRNGTPRVLEVIPSIARVLDKLCSDNDVREQTNPEAMATPFHGIIPPNITVMDYLIRIHTFADPSDECFVIALIYIDRLIERQSTFLVTSRSIHRLLITSIMLAAKLFDDVYASNDVYARVGGVHLSELNKLELELLFYIDFNLHVYGELYHHYTRQLVNSGGATATPTIVPAAPDTVNDTVSDTVSDTPPPAVTAEEPPQDAVDQTPMDDEPSQPFEQPSAQTFDEGEFSSGQRWMAPTESMAFEPVAAVASDSTNDSTSSNGVDSGPADDDPLFSFDDDHNGIDADQKAPRASPASDEPTDPIQMFAYQSQSNHYAADTTDGTNEAYGCYNDEEEVEEDGAESDEHHQPQRQPQHPNAVNAPTRGGGGRRRRNKRTPRRSYSSLTASARVISASMSPQQSFNPEHSEQSSHHHQFKVPDNRPPTITVTNTQYFGYHHINSSNSHSHQQQQQQQCQQQTDYFHEDFRQSRRDDGDFDVFAFDDSSDSLNDPSISTSTSASTSTSSSSSSLLPLTSSAGAGVGVGCAGAGAGAGAAKKKWSRGGSGSGGTGNGSNNSGGSENTTPLHKTQKRQQPSWPVWPSNAPRAHTAVNALSSKPQNARYRPRKKRVPQKLFTDPLHVDN